MIVYQKKLLRIAEYWDGEEPKLEGVDLVRCFQRPQPLAGMLCREFYTILLDLNRDPQQLLNKIKRDTRYEIRRAGAQDQLTFDFQNGRNEKGFRAFCDYYDDFANQAAQPKIN